MLKQDPLKSFRSRGLLCYITWSTLVYQSLSAPELKRESQPQGKLTESSTVKYSVDRFGTPMAAHHFLHSVLLLLIVLIGVAWIQRTNKGDDDVGQSISGSLTEHWPSVEDGEIDADEEDDNLTAGTTSMEQEASLTCRCWSAPAETGSFLETECKCRGLRITSVPDSLPTDVHRM